MGLGLGAANSIDNARLYKTLKKRNTARATVKTTLSNDSNHRRAGQMKETRSIQDFFWQSCDAWARSIRTARGSRTAVQSHAGIVSSGFHYKPNLQPVASGR